MEIPEEQIGFFWGSDILAAQFPALMKSRIG